MCRGNGIWLSLFIHGHHDAIIIGDCCCGRMSWSFVVTSYAIADRPLSNIDVMADWRGCLIICGQPGASPLSPFFWAVTQHNTTKHNEARSLCPLVYRHFIYHYPATNWVILNGKCPEFPDRAPALIEFPSPTRIAGSVLYLCGGRRAAGGRGSLIWMGLVNFAASMLRQGHGVLWADKKPIGTGHCRPGTVLW